RHTRFSRDWSSDVCSSDLIDRSPGFLTYGLLGAFVLGNAYPLWWSFVVGSGTNATRGETFPLIPGGNFISNMGKVLDAIPFWKRSEEHTSELQSRENLVCR